MEKIKSILRKFKMAYLSSYSAELKDLQSLLGFRLKVLKGFYERYKGKEDRLIYAINSLNNEDMKLVIGHIINICMRFSSLLSHELDYWFWYDQLITRINQECL